MNIVKNVKKTMAALGCLLLVGMLAGCGAKFDAAAYLQANLDNAYKNDSAALIQMKICTAEEASDIYRRGIDGEMNAFLASYNVSDELKGEVRELFEEMFSKVKYTVGEAEKQEKNYVVTVTYEQMQIFAPLMEDYLARAEALAGTIQTLPEEQQVEKLIGTFRDSFRDALAGVQYAQPAQTTINIELTDNVYMPSRSDMEKLEAAFFDMDQLDLQE